MLNLSGTEKQIIPLEVLLGAPYRACPSISPDGKLVAYLAPYEGVLNLWIMPTDGGEPRVLTHENELDIDPYYSWTMNGKILFRRDPGRAEDFQFYLLDPESGAASP